MAQIRPFHAIRPKAGFEQQIAALPYDVYSSMEAREAVKDKPLSFLHIDRPELGFAPGYDMYAPEVYTHAHDLLWQYIEDGTFIREEQPCYYIYRLVMDGRAQTGFVGCASVLDYESGVIKKHENTRAEKEQDRIRHVTACEAQTGPIFLAYRNRAVLQDIMDRYVKEIPAYDFTSEDGIRHSGWIVSDSGDIETIARAFAEMDAIYIADGHHRCASAVRVGQEMTKSNPAHTGEEEYNYFLSVLFPDETLSILAYNRIVKDLNGLSKEAFLKRLETDFTFTCRGNEAVSPQQKGTFGMYLDHSWYLLAYKGTEASDPVERLDVSILQDYLLSPILGIGDPRTDKRIDFIGGIRGLSELERRVDGGEAVAFSMYPTQIRELFEVADAGLLMPPKSTWFEPKLRSGLYIHSIGKERG